MGLLCRSWGFLRWFRWILGNIRTEHPTPFPISFDIQAAFPLSFYDEKAAAVLTEKTLGNPERHVVVFHEFVHCFQWETCERELRKELEIEKQQRELNNFSWEIDYPFPYNDDFFVRMTSEMVSFEDYHAKMKEYLKVTDFEYLVWQEWKEGFARYVENLMRGELKMDLKRNTLSPPYDRVSFYELGSRYVDLLVEEDSTLGSRLDKLFYTMALYVSQ